jgi:putative nucleotidyltransferase with HDIG domain
METTNYWSPGTDFSWKLTYRFVDVGAKPRDTMDLRAMLEPLRIKNKDHYEHSLRVAILAQEIAKEMGLDQRAMLYAGLCHDIGKALVSSKVLSKDKDWTAEDSEAIKTHVGDGFRLLRDRFDFTAEIMVWHHRFQKNCYPIPEPELLHQHARGTQVMISFYGRLLALADVFDALHRVNPMALTGSSIREAIEKSSPDLKPLIDRLYERNIFRLHENAPL